MKIKKLLLLSALSLLGIWIGYTIYNHRFSPNYIHIKNLTAKPGTVDQQVVDDLQVVLNQKFTYLDRGRQCYAFISEDGKYVLKFFDGQRLTMPQKLKRLVEGYQLAYERDKENTGLIYVQLNPNPKIDVTVYLIDSFGTRHTVNLGEVPFIVQQKATPTRLLISECLSKGDVQQAKALFGQIVNMYIADYKKGIIDGDHNFMYNTGFVDGHPIRIDVGRLAHDEKLKKGFSYYDDLEKVAIHRIDGWMKRHFPQYRHEIVSDMHAKLDTAHTADISL